MQSAAQGNAIMLNFLARRFQERITTGHLQVLAKLDERTRQEIWNDILHLKKDFANALDKKVEAKRMMSEAMSGRRLAIALGAKDESHPLWLRAALQESWATACLNISQGRISWTSVRDLIESHCADGSARAAEVQQ
jgi:hypothetical protein